jgi:hypothetical protein
MVRQACYITTSRICCVEIIVTLILLPVAAGLALDLSAFASKPPEPAADFDPEYNFSQPKTIGFCAMSGGVTGNNPTKLTDFQRDRIDSALRSAPEAKGFEFVTKTADADLLLSWHLNLMEKTDVKTYNSPSYGASMGYNRYNCMNQTNDRVTEYTEGTFIIDMIDPAENASFWRSVTQSKLTEETIRDQTALDAAAMRVLAGFPPGVASTTP